jgi:hypothetical protein
MNENLNKLREPRGAFVPLFIYGVMTGVGLLLTQFAFTRGVRNQILERDGYRCTVCGATDHLEAAHVNHNRDYPYYNSPDNGRTLDSYCHLIDHIERAGSNGLLPHHNEWAIQKLAERAYVSPEELEDIRLNLVSV